MRILYLDIFCGISGDMLLGALVDAGADPAQLRQELAGMAPGLWDLEARKVSKRGMAATQVSVLPPGQGRHDHTGGESNHTGDEDFHTGAPVDHTSGDLDHTGAHPDHTGHAGEGHHHGHGGAPAEHEKAPSAHHQDRPGGDHHDHGRSYADLRQILEGADIAEKVKDITADMLMRLAEAEAAIHDVPAEEVHFHEVGGLDTLVDLAGAVVGMELLGIDRVQASPVPWSHGHVQTAHGLLPVPAPATAKLLEGLPVRPVDVEGETVTPTGAVLVRHLAASFGPPPSMTVAAIGHGAGVKDFPGVPNLLRVVVGEAASHEAWGEDLVTDAVVELAANVDDMPPELFEPAMEAVFAAGALDAWMTPIQMKRGRPATMFSALAPTARADAVAEAMLVNTTSLGVRRGLRRRTCLPREMARVATAYGEVAVKVARLGGRVVTAQPEYRDCVARAKEAGAPVREVYSAALAAAQALRERA